MAKKFMDKGGGGTSRFSVEKCVSHSAEIFRLRGGGGESIIVAIILSKEKVSIRGGGIKIFSRKTFVSQCRNFSYANSLVLHYFRVLKKFGKERGVSSFPVENFLSHSAENFCKGNL